MNNSYYPEINIARGLAVLCVLIGHSFPDSQTGITSPTALWIETAMYSFHMGCFFFLSGFVSAKKLCADRLDIRSEFLKKVKRLAVPYLFYSFLTLGLKQIFSVFANNQFRISELWKIFIGKNPNGGLWYLWTLFIISLLFLCLNQFTRKCAVYCAAGIILYLLYLIFPDSFLRPVLSYSIYFVLGIFVQHNYKKFSPFLHRNFGKFCGVVSGILFLFLVTYTNAPYLITCLLGTFVLFLISRSISRKTGRLNYLLNELGNYSYDIYLTSYFVQIPIRVVCYRVFSLPYWIVVLMMFLFGTIVPYFVCKYIIRKIPIANKILLGNWK